MENYFATPKSKTRKIQKYFDLKVLSFGINLLIKYVSHVKLRKVGFSNTWLIKNRRHICDSASLPFIKSKMKLILLNKQGSVNKMNWNSD